MEEKYFEGITTCVGAKRRFRALAKKHHPDLHPGVDPQIMQEINTQYKKFVAQRESVKTVTLTDAITDGQAGTEITLEEGFLQDCESENATSEGATADELEKIIDAGLELGERLGRMLLSKGVSTVRQRLKRRFAP